MARHPQRRADGRPDTTSTTPSSTTGGSGAEEKGGCGCTAVGGDDTGCWRPGALLAMGALFVARRRRDD